MPRILLLCFVHGFKDLKAAVAGLVPDHDRVETAVYPRYETKGELAVASAEFLDWLKARVMDVRKAHLDAPWPPNDRQVGVVLVAHSMGGFVAADALFLALDERDRDNDSAVLFPPIQGLLALDTPYNGLSRSMFVYGAFSSYSKVQTVFNVMTALSAGPVALGRLALGRAGKPPSSSASSPAWKVWQLVAVRTGTVGAIAAGGVAAYTHRKAIMAGVDRVRRGLTEKRPGTSTPEGTADEPKMATTPTTSGLRASYQSGVDAIGQGLAYINRRNVGASFAWLSAHLTFVGALLKQAELNHRLQRLAGLRGGLGVHDLYVSLGANGYWSGGYFVPERTFCAVPEEAEKADGDEGAVLPYERWTMACEDEVQAHISLFKRDKNPGYDALTRRAAVIVASWFANEEPVVDTVGPLRGGEAEAAEKEAAAVTAATDAAICVTDDGVEILGSTGNDTDADTVDGVDTPGASLPDESPIDIAAAASLRNGSTAESAIVIDDDDDDEDTAAAVQQGRATYLRHLLSVAQNAGTGLKRASEWSSQLPTKMPRMDGMALPSMPAMPTIPAMPNMPGMPSMPTSASTLIPSTKLFSRFKGEGPSGSSASSVSGKEETDKVEKTVSDGNAAADSVQDTATGRVDDQKNERRKDDG